jgi:hypothetical protein
MEPEEIDKLFRDKLAGLSATPPADAWMRLQQKMEPPKKERTMWIYYAAASVVILLVAGILYFRNGADPAGPAVATTPVLAPPVPVSPAEKPATPKSPEAPLQLQNREPASQIAQVPPADPVREPAGAKKNRLAAKPRRLNPAPSTKAAMPEPAPVLAATSQPEATETRAPSPPATVAKASPAGTAPAIGVVEVVVARGPEPSAGEDLTLRENLSRKGNLLKNIYQQARNLKNGDPVELATLGVDKGKIQEETRELKQKLTNVISL